MVYADIRGVSLETIDIVIIENVDFQSFRTLRLRHLMKRDQRHYIIAAYI